ncbi:hypothetical protein FACS189413_13570 [Bacteroidia bacterium]|nr:hypothetical protein FACS189413_13570 [Bacteroidia bacterium]
MKTHIETALEEFKNIATFNSNAKIFDKCLLKFFSEFKISTITDVENLSILAKNENLGKLYIDKAGKFTFDNPSNNLTKLFDDNNIDCQTLKQAADIIKEKTKKNNADFENVLSKFKDCFCDGQNYNPQVIHYITSIESLNISDTVQEICFHFIKSFLNAEFLILDDFSDKIEETRKQIKNYYAKEFTNKQKNSKNLSFYIVKSLFQALYYAVEICKKHEHYLYNSEERLICLNNDRQLRFYRTPAFSQVDFTIGKKEVLPYGRLMESVIDTTVIDLDYTVTEDNFDKLFRLWRRVKVVEKYQSPDPKWLPVLSMLKTKTAILLKRMLDSKINDSDYKIVNVEAEEKQEIEKYYNQFIQNDLFKKNPFIKIVEDNKNEVLDKTQFNTSRNDIFSDQRKHKDTCTYDNYAKEGIEIYCNNSPYFKDDLSGEDIEKLLTLLENNNHRHFNSQTLFVKLIKTSTKNIEDKLKNFTYKDDAPEIEKRLNLLSKLLVEMERFTERARTNKIKQFMPVFAYSFYAVENEKISFAGNLKDKIEKYTTIDIKTQDFANYFFIASAGLAPINIFYLESEITKWKINIQELNFEYDHVLSKKAVKEEIKIMLEKNEQKQQETQKETITILGVFAALLAFVTASVGLIKIAQNLFEYAVFGVIFTSALLMFIVVINLIWKKRDKDETRKVYFGECFALPLSIIIVMVGILFVLSKCTDLKENNKQEQKTEMLISNDHRIPDKADVQNHNSGEDLQTQEATAEPPANH